MFQSMMLKQVYIILTLFSITKNVPVVFGALEAKVVGGMPVKVSSFPYAAQLFNMDSMCGGTIISSQAVLTAAHCFSFNKNIDSMMIRTGESGDEAMRDDDSDTGIYDVWDLFIHSEYDDKVFSNDIAVVFASQPFKLGDKVKKLLLVDTDAWMQPQESFTAIGWGWTSYGGPTSNSLMMTHLHFVPLDVCMKDHDDTKLTKDMFCLYGDGTTDTCLGDSGGGVSWNGLLVGIVSHGDGCAKKNKPSVYSNVWYFRAWIRRALLKFHNNYCTYAFGDGPPSLNNHEV